MLYEHGFVSLLMCGIDMGVQAGRQREFRVFLNRVTVLWHDEAIYKYSSTISLPHDIRRSAESATGFYDARPGYQHIMPKPSGCCSFANEEKCSDTHSEDSDSAMQLKSSIYNQPVTSATLPTLPRNHFPMACDFTLTRSIWLPRLGAALLSGAPAGARE